MASPSSTVPSRFHPPASPSVGQEFAIKDLRQAFRLAEQVILIHTPVGRLQSLALTSLEEACMWANKGLFQE